MPLFFLGFISVVYFLSIANTIFGGDSGDVVSAVLTHGFAHPPGYSLYTFLGILANLVPLEPTAAGRITLISTLATIGSLYLFTIIVREFTPRVHPVFLTITLTVLACNYVVWLYSSVAEVFPLNTILSLGIFYCAIRCYKTKKVGYLYGIAFLSGLCVAHHHTFVLILPGVVYLLWQVRKNLSLTGKTVTLMSGSLVLGLLPLLYLWIAFVTKGEVIWGSLKSFAGFFALLSRQGYGSFVVGSFVSHIPEHRLLQFKNLFLFLTGDFTILAIILFVLALVGYFRYAFQKDKPLFRALFLTLMFTGPFFFFYANFPLSGNFLFATQERFLHLFYFFFAFSVYFGLVYGFQLIREFIITKGIHNPLLKKIATTGIMVLLCLYPLAIVQKNAPRILALRSDKTAENLGKDILNNATDHSIVLLAQDTLLFNTQYVYYSKLVPLHDKILVHISKLESIYYPDVLKEHYNKLKISVNKKGSIGIDQFIRDNIGSYAIYSTERYSVPSLAEYEWIPQGMLFRLVPKDQAQDQKYVDALETYWNTSKNKDLEQRVKKQDNALKNYFTSDIARVYSIGHQNSAYYFLQQNRYKEAYIHLEAAQVLDPTDADPLYLFSIFHEKQKECTLAEQTIDLALQLNQEKMYINQLLNLTDCFSNETDKKRIQDKVMNLLKKTKTSLKQF
ncbi:DUF2723 domain-containing protein [Candidatus Roizmanbacteria bacterium]|nr:DUF2723 domain-containing protein [Candidatus Roizmanbacteria bacterium]